MNWQQHLHGTELFNLIRIDFNQIAWFDGIYVTGCMPSNLIVFFFLLILHVRRLMDFEDVRNDIFMVEVILKYLFPAMWRATTTGYHMIWSDTHWFKCDFISLCHDRYMVSLIPYDWRIHKVRHILLKMLIITVV